MKRISTVLLLLAVLVTAPAPAAYAQEAVSVEATIGLQGYVVPFKSTTLTVRVSADVLFVGDMQISVGSVNLFSPIEVPAGSSKEYVLAIPTMGSNSRAVVQLFPNGSDEHLVREVVTVLNEADQLLVGVVGAPSVEPALSEAGSTPFGRDLTVLSLSEQELAGDLAPLSYLVAGKGVLATVDRDVLTSLAGWVKGGGRLIGAVADLQLIEGQAGEAVVFSEEAVMAPLGSGELFAVDDPATVGRWEPLVRDLPPLSLSTNQFNEGFGFQMVEAASAGGETATPGLPWLLGALAAYVILVGPVNFLTLRRLGRRELAWVTIPAISLLMLGVLWIVGRSQLDDRIVTHASIVVQDQSGVSRAHTTLIVAAGGEGEHTLDVPEGWSVAPLDVSMMFGQSSRMEARVGPAPTGGTRLGFELPNLGAATATATWSPARIPLRAEVTMDGNNLSATMHNDGAISFWAWGIGTSSTARAASGPLDPGQIGTTNLNPNAVGFNEGGGMIADAVMSQGNWDWSGPRDPWQRVWPLSESMFWQEPRVLQSGPYFFGYTDDFEVEVAVDEYTEVARGPALVVIPLDAPLSVGAASGVGEIVRIVGADFVDSYPGWVYASGADAVEMLFRVDTGASGSATIDNRNGHIPNVEKVEVYDWTSGSFDEYPWPGGFPIEDYLSPADEVMVRIVLADGQFNDLDLPVNGVRLAMRSS